MMRRADSRKPIVESRIFLFFSFLVFQFFSFTASGFAQEVTILYTGQTHAMLYPCSCPIQQDGGVSRRAALVKELRKKDPGLLLLDCGNFTAGGLLDEYTQSAQLDMQRSEVNYKSLELMQYDAVGIGPDEFNFGKDFFLKNSRKNNPAYLSANLNTDSSSTRVLPYVIKDAAGVKIGIIGLTSLSAAQKTEGLKIGAPEEIGKLVSRLKKEGVQIVILLSTLGEQEDLKLISEVKGLDLVFVGQNPLTKDSLTKVDSTFLLRPAWQGRKLGKLSLEIKEGKLLDCKLAELRLAENIADDAGIGAILPRCYSDSNCKKGVLSGNCQNPGALQASCLFKAPNKVNLLVINVQDCAVCNAEPVINSLKQKFPGIAVRYLYYPDPEAQKKVREFSLPGLPAYIFGREIEKEDGFSAVKNIFLQAGNNYLLKPQASGLAYFLNRKIKKGALDLFFSLFEKDASGILANTREFKPNLHFLAAESGAGFAAKGGVPEVEEYLRGVCAQKYYPQKFWDYLICRSKDITSAYWEDCLGGAGPLKVKSCAQGPEGAKLLKQNINLNKELQISSGPVYLSDNQKIFSSRGVPAKEDLKRIIKR